MIPELCAECGKTRWAHYDQQEGPALLGYIMHKYVPFHSRSEQKRIVVQKGWDKKDSEKDANK